MVIEASKTIRVLATGKPSHYYVAKDHITKEDYGPEPEEVVEE